MRRVNHFERVINACPENINRNMYARLLSVLPIEYVIYVLDAKHSMRPVHPQRSLNTTNSRCSAEWIFRRCIHRDTLFYRLPVAAQACTSTYNTAPLTTNQATLSMLTELWTLILIRTSAIKSTLFNL